ncbi:efflux RND transporter periplasmic adaptor subunit [Sphaerotilus mobilis]|uniref:RND family efflux transporter MFP subunit n=1 Tax=Sphaerotilus mobilis TaxID=47994 RepID=A0A4Q7LK20_9BURK|nr:efflux RND transporter periplasmic adaptor subunit [Sphaerotilus mobilis]RZS54451.1 RND family efflux transporter MFP subunit [Sphaerotilus mobilis]
MTRSTRHLAPIAAVLALAGLVTTPATVAAGAEPVAAAIPVPTVTLQAQTIAGSLTLDASLQAVRQATVAAQVGGNVVALAVKAGDRVRAGQLLARIDERSTAAALAQGDAAVNQADAAARLARIERDRSRELHAQGYVSQAALDRAETQARAAEAALAQAQAGRGQAALARGFANVVAPFDGIVLATHLEAGDLAAPGRPVLTVYAPGALRAVVAVPASLAAQVRAASQIEIELADGRRLTPARRSELPGTDAVTQTLEWRLDLAGADAATLSPGLSVRARFEGLPIHTKPSAAGTALSVPRSAVLQRGELSAVYVADTNNHYVLRAVRTGPLGGESVSLLSGVRAGERIAADAVKAGLAGARPSN